MKLGLIAATIALAPFAAGCLSFHEGPLPGAPENATYADIDGVHVRYVDEGAKDAPPVVLVHGFASSLETWEAVIPALTKKHRVLALDLKGFGWTARPDGDYSPAAQAKLVFGLMDQRGVKRAALVGHSWGSSVVLAMAIEHPERADKIALYDAWVYEEQLPAFFVWSRAGGIGETLFALFYGERADERMEHAFFDKERYVTEPFVEAVDRALDRPGTKAAALAATRGQRFDTWQDQYKTIATKTLLLWGREDEVTALPFGERLSHDLKDARLVVYPQCGHFPMIEATARSNEDLVTFLDDGGGR
jgi:pimeloyl-ACP methyl ester carboxylesterase